ncbi:MAG TPA: hypothetical protein VGF30_06765, partial [Bacteroidia bacterium]
TVTINGAGATNVTGTYPNFTINSPVPTDAQTLSLAGNTLSISNGNSVSLPQAINFGAIATNGSTVNSSSSLPVPFTLSYNNGGGTYAGGIYTAPVPGIYHIDASVMWSSSLLGTNELSICIDGVPVRKKTIAITGLGTLTESFGFSADINVNTGQQISITYSFGGSSVSVTDNVSWWFNGHLIK